MFFQFIFQFEWILRRRNSILLLITEQVFWLSHRNIWQVVVAKYMYKLMNACISIENLFPLKNTSFRFGFLFQTAVFAVLLPVHLTTIFCKCDNVKIENSWKPIIVLTSPLAYLFLRRIKLFLFVVGCFRSRNINSLHFTFVLRIWIMNNFWFVKR